MKKNRILYVVSLFILLIILITGFYSSIRIQSNREILIYNNKLFNNTVKEEYDFSNKNVIGYLSIDNTNIKNTIVQGKDNKYYLTHNANNEEDINGVPFLDYRVSTDSRIILIYGHNSNTLNMPFNYLENYYDANYYKKHQIINFKIEKGLRKYKIFSVYVEPSDYTYYNKLIYYNSEEYYDYLKIMKNKSLYDTRVDIEKEDNIIILQTCSYKKEYKKYKDKFLLVIGKEIK